ncbi:MAG: DUF4062 domain-containing protein [Saprospiraceae bacterium]|nr:DUF4062 domain-containing protein [Saprospiraceae bacterium]
MARFSKVFISSTYIDLIEHRQEVYNLITQKLGLTSVAMEDFGAMSEEPVMACLDKVQECDLFIGFYAKRYGFIPEDSEGLSITEMEYDKARQEGKLILCFWLDRLHDWPAEKAQEEYVDHLDRFKDKIQKNHVIETFGSPENLAYKISIAIARIQSEQEDILSDLELPLDIGLPSEPYLGLYYFRREHARIFFGRNADIRELYKALQAFNIVLLSGQSGSGKSSLLLAGLLPRMEKKNWHCIYVRLTDGDVVKAIEEEIREEEKSLIIIDQLEELFVHDNPENEVRRLALLQLVETRCNHQTKIILSFRKETLLEVMKMLETSRVDYDKVLLSNLDRQGITEAIRGISSSALVRKYKVEFASGLAEEIAGDIINDRESNVAPLLQILLRKMYDSCPIGSNGKRQFNQSLYYQFRSSSLEEMLDTQLADLGLHFPNAQKFGLDLDMLYRLTTELGTAANSITESAFRETYCHLDDIPQIIHHLIDLFLVIRIGEEDSDPKLRIAHDSLAPLIRKKYQNSDAPGPKAYKILANRQKEIETGLFVELTRNDLEAIAEGREGMRCLTDAEEKVISENLRKMRKREEELEEKSRKLEQQNIQLQEANRRMEDMARMVVKGLSKGLVNAARLSYEMKNYSRAFRLAEQALRIQRNSIEAKNLMIQVYNHIPYISDLTGFCSEFNSIYPAPDGHHFLAVHADHTATVWTTAGKMLGKLAGHQKSILCAAFSPDGTHIVTGSADGTVRVWERNGKPLHVLANNEAVLQIDLAANGHILIASGISWKIWSLDNTLILEKRAELNQYIAGAAITADGRKVLIATSGRTAQIWDVESRTAVDLDAGEDLSITGAVLSPNNYLVALSCRNSRRVHFMSLWSIEGRQLASIECVESSERGSDFNFSLLKLAFTPDNRYIVGVAKNLPMAIVWNLKGERMGALGKSHTQQIIDVSFSDDSSRALTASLDGTVKVWNMESGKLLVNHMAHQDSIQKACFIENGEKILSVGEDHSAFIWPGRQAVPNIHVRHQNSIFSAAYSPDGKKILTTSRDGTIAIWDQDGNELRRIVVTGSANQESGVFRATFSPDGFRIVTSGLDGLVKIWNYHGDLIASLQGHRGRVYEASFSSDGDYILTSSADGLVRVWSSEGELVKDLEGHTDKVYSAAFSKDGNTVLSSSNDGSTIVWKNWKTTAEKTIIGQLQHARPAPVYRAIFSPDEKLILCACKDGAFRLWDLNGSLHKKVQAHDPGSEVFWADFSPDGNFIVTASVDKTARVFNLDGEPIAILHGHSKGIGCAIFSPDGSKILTTSADRTVKIWEISVSNILQQSNMRGVGFLHRDDLMDFEIAMAHSSINYDNVREMLADGAYLPNLHQYARYYWELAKRSTNDSPLWLEKAKTLYDHLLKEYDLPVFAIEAEQVAKEIAASKTGAL